ncbi:MAG: ABC transporter ATP-binding protein [Deltaproteobacteria bacterium RBG_16_47_11]|nr:MAG: ABC transporter ATP-binding protein [Deltaproteobacteria bacterium RBG_16_47_11]
MALLEIKGLTKNFGGLRAVDSLDIRIEEGEILGIIGPNGAGKTTVFNLITGVFSPDEGRIVFEGHEITGLSPQKVCHKGIARTFQLIKPFGDMTTLENVMIGAFCRAEKLSTAMMESEKIIDFAGLSLKRNFLAKNLTIGDRKRLELARALATQPKILLLDEVMAGLNPKETIEAIQLINQIQSRGMTLLVIEHVMRAIMSLSSRIVMLNYGKKIAEGNPKEISSDEKVIKAYLGERYDQARNERS